MSGWWRQANGAEKRPNYRRGKISGGRRAALPAHGDAGAVAGGRNAHVIGQPGDDREAHVRGKLQDHAVHPGGGRRCTVQRTTAGIGRGRAPASDYRSTSAAAFELHSSRLGSAPSAADKISDLKGLAGFEAGRSDWRSSPPAESGAYLSMVYRRVKAERAGNAEDSGPASR